MNFLVFIQFLYISVKSDVLENGEEPNNEVTETKLRQLQATLENLQDKLRKSEQKREHWRLECQLLNLKLGKFQNGEYDDVAKNSSNESKDIVLVQEPVQNQLNELVAAKLTADSKATHFYLECLALQKRIKFWDQTKKKAQKELARAQNCIGEIQDEAKITNTNYEDQLNLMSEHLANMNDKLTSQTDEIDRLKYELANKKSNTKK